MDTYFAVLWKIRITKILCLWNQLLGMLWLMGDYHCIGCQNFRQRFPCQPWRMNTFLSHILYAIYYLWGDFSRMLGPSWRWTFNLLISCTPQYFWTTMVPLVWLNHLGQIKLCVTFLWSITSPGGILVRGNWLWSREWNPRSRSLMYLPRYSRKEHSIISGI